MIERAVDIIARAFPGQDWSGAEVSLMTKHEKSRFFVVVTDRTCARAAVIKIDERSAADLRRNFEVFSRLREAHAFLRATTAQPLYCGELDGVTAYIEEFIRANNFRWQPLAGQVIGLGRVGEWVAAFNRLSLEPTTSEAYMQFLSSHAETKKLRSLLNFSEDEFARDCSAVLRDKGNYCFSHAHGDFTPYNLLVDRQGLVVVDWNNFKEKSLLWYDLLCFFCFFYYIRHRGDFKKGFMSAFARRSLLSYPVRRSLAHYAADFKIPLQSAKATLWLVLADLYHHKQESTRDIVACADWAARSRHTIFDL